MPDGQSVLNRLREARQTELQPADYHRLARELREAPEIPGLQPARVGFLSSYSIRFVEPFLTVEAARQGLRLNSYYGPFGQFEQVLLDPASDLFQHEPDAVVLAMRPEDVDVDAAVRYYSHGGAQRFRRSIADLTERLIRCAEVVRRHSAAAVLVSNFAPPSATPLGVFEANQPDSLLRAMEDGNEQLRRGVETIDGAVIWDYAGLVRRCGADGWTDPRLWALAKIAVAADNQPKLAEHLTRTLCGVLRTRAKCLVLDLDNTVWGGAIGDDGPEGIQLGNDFPGSAYRDFQRWVLSLLDRGILLAIVSKNDEATVEPVLREHPEMLIRPEHIAARRINWAPKSRNIREIAAELNIGCDAMVLFDDNPVERAEVSLNVPGMTVVEVPSDPLRYPETLQSIFRFDAPSLTHEDRERPRLYRLEKERRALRTQFEDMEEFLDSLDMVAEVGRGDTNTLSRIAQLVGKTNQFNLTTRRHSQAAIAEMCEDEDHIVAWLRLRDRFSDLGLVAVGIVERQERNAIIDTFLLSCRVMGRRAEHAMIAYLVEEARALGCQRMLGEYLPTKKNHIVRQFYSELGFESCGPTSEGIDRFSFDLTNGTLDWPAVIGRVQHASSDAQN